MATALKGKENTPSSEGLSPVRALSHQRPIYPGETVGFENTSIYMAAGNQALQRLFQQSLIQAKLSVSQSGDSDETEADRVSENITSGKPPKTIQPNNVGEGKVQPKEASGRTARIDRLAVEQIASLRGSGEPLSPSLRSFFEPRFRQDFSQVRVHTDPSAAELATGINSRAFTVGQDVVFAPGEYATSSPEGHKLIAHELTHVVQQQRASTDISQLTSLVSSRSHLAEIEATHIGGNVGILTASPSVTAVPKALLHRDDPQPQASELPFTEHPNIGTFVLDPSIADVATPDLMTTHVKIQEPLAVGVDDTQYQDRFVRLERPVRSARRIGVYAVPLEEVFETMLEASAIRPMFMEQRPLVAPSPGTQAWTASGPITVTNVRDNIVFTEAPNFNTVGAGAVVLLETDSGSVLIDAGLQMNDPGLAATLGEELSSVLIPQLGPNPIGEAILARNPPSAHALPYFANQIRILSIRATVDQYDDGSVAAVLRAQSEYRKWYESSLREQLNAGRSEWENTQPIAPNNSIREQRWKAHVEEEMASATINYQPPTQFVAEQVDDTTLEMRDEQVAPFQSAELDPIPDLSQTEWELADDQQIIIYGNGRLTLFPSTGILLRPATSPTPAPKVPAAPPKPLTVSGLRPGSPVGPSPAVPRPVTPWMVLSAVGKEMHVVVRLSGGYGILIDAGGPRAVTMDAFAGVSMRLGVISVEKILITHPHSDHVRYLVELIKEHNITPRDLVVSRSWIETGATGSEEIVEALRTTTEQRLIDLGYGEQWNAPGVAVPAEGVTRLRIVAGQSEIDVYARGEAHQEYQTQRRDLRQGRRKTMASEKADSASFLYVFGNESSPNRTAVLGDFRGEDIVEMHRSLGQDQFAEAFRNVRVIKGIGHHFSLTAGRTPTDIRGMNLLLENTLVRNGELTIMVQSTETFAFGGATTTAGPEGALLRYLMQQGVKVVFAGSSTADVGGAVMSSDVQVTTHGTGVQVLEGADPRVSDMLRRLSILREARRTVAESPEWGPAALGMEQRKGADLQQQLDVEIQRLEGLARELRGHASVELLESRGPAESRLTGPQAAERRAFRAENITEGRTVEQILTEMAQPGPVEAALSADVRARLRAALASGRSMALELELAATPRGVLEAIEQLPEARRSSLAKKYREMAELTSSLEADVVPDAQRLQIFLRAIDLRNELRLALEEAGAARPPALDAELARLNSVLQQFEAHTVRETEIGRDLEGRRTRTEYVKLRANDLIQKGFHSLGRGMGAVMVIHSVEELGDVARDVALGDANIPEAMLRVAHSAYGMHIGVRMARTTYSQLTAGTGGKVYGWEFGIMAVIEIGAAVAADYKTSEERNAAILGTAIHSSVNLLCMYVGQAIMNLSAKFLHHPIAKLAGMGIGLAIMMAGERIISFLGLDDDVERWTSFPPGEVTDVNRKIHSVLNDYKIIIGSQQLQNRSPSELSELGVQFSSSARLAASSTGDDYAQAVQSKESELTRLFEDAYDRTRGSFAGIQMLDQQAAEFLRLRGLAMEGRDDPGRADLDQRWRAMDQRLDLSGATAETIKNMEQWNDLEEKMTELANAVTAKKVDLDDVFENLDEAQLMIENARYRLDPRRGGVYRTTPLIPPGTEAHRVYTELLRSHETRLAGFHGYLLVLGGHEASEEIFKFNQVDPRTALVRLRTIRNNYVARVQATANAFPNLALPETWATPGTFARAVENANREKPGWFIQLRIVEKTLESAARQASSSLLLASTPPDETLRKLIEEEIAFAIKAIETRRTHFGLVFLYELDALLEQRGSDEDRILATEINAAYPTAKACTGGSAPAPFTETELDALHTESFKAHGGEQLTSTERQLAEVRRIMAPMRQADPNIDAMRDWEKLARVVDRVYFILPNPYKQWDKDAKIDFVDEYHYDTSLTPIVAKISDWDVVSLYYGPFAKVIPVNQDAVRLLGRGHRLIQTKDGKAITEEEMLKEAKKNAPL